MPTHRGAMRDIEGVAMTIGINDPIRAGRHVIASLDHVFKFGEWKGRRLAIVMVLNPHQVMWYHNHPNINWFLSDGLFYECLALIEHGPVPRIEIDDDDIPF